MNKHTPGPWKVTGEELVSVGDQELFHRVIRDEGERWTALVEIEDREGEANARLIAAAPVMYEALQAMLNGILFTRGASMSEDRWQTLTTIARTALSQAEGRQHE